MTFLDILGFRHIVGSERAAKIAKMLSMLRRTTESSDSAREPDVLHYAFSDSVVRVRKIRDSLTETLALEANDLGLAQVDLIHHDVLLRGGMTAGYIFADEQSVFGPALIRAYDIESRFAIFPRVVVDDRLEIYVPSRISFGDPFLSQIFRNDLGKTWIDYLSVAYAELDEDADIFDLLWKHKHTAEEGMENWSIDRRVQKKYRWLAHYHNSFCMSRYSPDDGVDFLVQNLPQDVDDWLFRRQLATWFKRFSSRWTSGYNFSDEHEAEPVVE